MVWKPFFVTPRVPASPRPFHINPLVLELGTTVAPLEREIDQPVE
jgi:hypothetical protein